MGSIILSVAVVAIGVALGIARGGRIDAVRSARPQWWALLVIGFALQAFAENVDITGATSLSVIGMFLLITGLVANAQIRGSLITAFGVTLNLIVLALNGAVPIRFEALSAAGIIDDATERSQVTSVGHLLELETADTTLASLGDTIPAGFANSVLSIGDLVTFAGVIVIVSNLIAARRSVGVAVNELFGLPAMTESIDLDADSDLHADFAPETDLDLEPGLVAASSADAVSDLAAMFGAPPEGDGVLDIVDEPLIDVSAPRPAVPTTPEPIDLTFDPDDLWADDDAGVSILGPSSKSSG